MTQTNFLWLPGFKKGFKAAKFGKVAGAGFNKKFGAIKTFGTAQGFKFGKAGGAFAAGGAGKAKDKFFLLISLF